MDNFNTNESMPITCGLATLNICNCIGFSHCNVVVTIANKKRRKNKATKETRKTMLLMKKCMKKSLNIYYLLVHSLYHSCTAYFFYLFN